VRTRRETARVRDGDMMELQSANERRRKEKRRGRESGIAAAGGRGGDGGGGGRDCSRLARLP